MIATSRDSEAAFIQELATYGYREGDHLVIEYRTAEGQLERLPELADGLAHQPVDVIVASTTPPAVAAKRATSTIPIVFVNVGDPVATGLAASLARPGANLTGTSNLAISLSAEKIETLRAALPSLDRLAVLWNLPIRRRFRSGTRCRCLLGRTGTTAVARAA